MSSRKFPHYPVRRPGPVLSGLSLWLALFLALPPRFALLAGDILRGGSPAAAARGAGVEGQTAAALQAGAPSGTDTLARTTQALAAVKNMQAAAHAVAIGGPNNLGADPNHPGLQLPNVPNGLGPGGLQVAPGVGTNPNLWQGASLPTQTTSGTKTNVTIVQNQQQALLNWQTFNVGKNTHLLFDQTAGGPTASQWIAFNKINDPSGVPSQILGSLDALGQIYIINANGIIFGGSSQINLHSLVASALPINDNLIARGLLNNPDNQFLFSALPIPAGANGTPAFNPPASNTPDGHYGDVVVRAGAQISAPTSPDHVGGRVALIGANVDNEGTISTPDGQTILAAGLQVGFTAHSSSDPSLRGLDVFVGDVGTYAGTAINGGLIDSPRADIMITGKEVDQLGFINSSTSVALNGRVDLLADYNAVSSGGLPGLAPFLFQSSGTVTFGLDSFTAILPEVAGTDRVVGLELALRSQVNVRGHVIHLSDNSVVVAPNAIMNFDAGQWSLMNFSPDNFNPIDVFAYVGGQIYLDQGATIAAFGTVTSAPVSENIIAVQLRGTELANFPLQRDGPLRGQTVYVDIRQTGTYNGRTWIGTPLADVSGYVNLIQRTVGELTTAGGTINLNSGGSVVMQLGAVVDVSAGWINYVGGLVRTTQVVSEGHIFDISQATPDRVYDGIYNGFTVVHSKWGIVDRFTNPTMHFEPGYIYGAGGGTLNITGTAMALDGTLLGTTVTGPQQSAALPTPSTLSLTFRALDSLPPFPPVTLTSAPNITFETGVTLAPADPFALDSFGNPLPLRADRVAEVILSPELITTNGFNRIKIDNGDGNISVPAGVSLTFAPGGSLALAGANIDIQGNIIAPGGALSLVAYNISPAFAAFLLANTGGLAAPPPDPARGHFTLGPQALLDVSGLIIDDRIPTDSPLVTNGGSVSIQGYDVDLEAGSSIDASGGLRVSGSGAIAYGRGGSITVRGGQDPTIVPVLGGRLILDATLQAFSGTLGGSLSILAPAIQIGGTTSNPDVLLLTPDFFSQGGFNQFNLSGLGVADGQLVPGFEIVTGTVISPMVQNFAADISQRGQPTLSLITLPDGVRAPVNLNFTAAGVLNPFGGQQEVLGNFILENGAQILAEPGASVSVGGNTVAILGSIIAPGGNINVSGNSSSFKLFSLDPLSPPLITVDLGPNSLLSAAGTTVLTPNAFGFRTGRVLNGGSITVSGNIVAESGAVLDVSGATDILDLDPAYSGSPSDGSLTGPLLVPTRVDSRGGSITFRGGQELFIDATLIGDSGGPSAAGGTLTISSGRFYPINSLPPTPLDVTLEVTQSGPTIPTQFYPAGETAIGHVVVDATNSPVAGHGYFAADTFNDSGFDSISIKGTVMFDDAVDIAAPRAISLADGGVIFATGAVSLSAPYIALGMAFRPPLSTQDQTNVFLVNGVPFYFAPTFGSGSLTATGRLIDVGNLSLQNIGNLNLIAADGDIRGDGTLDVAGNISLTAGQIYPATAVKFTIAAYDYFANASMHPGTVSIFGSGTRQLPFSAGGQLKVYGSVINQDGTLRAPIGTINLGWDGTGAAPFDNIAGVNVTPTKNLTLGSDSITSVSAIDPITGDTVVLPYGVNQNGTVWIDPTGTDITVGGVPQKSITVSAANISDLPGSTVDIQGGGDLYAYQFFSGVGGTIDILNSSSSFAVIPGYQADYAPYATYATFNSSSVFGADRGYVNSNLSVGDRIYLNGSAGLPAGFYTLLPARYALLPGAFLVTPKTGTPAGSVQLPDGSALVSGYQFNDLNPAQTAAPLFASFEVASAAVFRARAQYNDFSADKYLHDSALAHDAAVPRLPIDAGHFVISALQTISIEGTLRAQAPAGGRGGLVDISSPLDILIAGPGAIASAGTLLLNAANLSAFGSESLLIGGIRETTSDGTLVHVATDNITVDNAGTPFTGTDIILVANDHLTLAAGADIEQTGAAGTAETLLFGNANLVGSGNGTLLRVSNDPNAQVIRSGVGGVNTASMTIGANAHLGGLSVTLDSTFATSIDPTVTLTATAVALNSGQISLQLNDPGALQPTSGLVLSSAVLQTLQASVQSLSLLSYSSIDIYGTGSIGGLDSSGVPVMNSLALHAGSIRGFNNNGGTVTFAAKTITLDNFVGSAALSPISAPSGTLAFTGNTVRLAANQLAISQFGHVDLSANYGIVSDGVGVLSVQGDLTMNAPLLTATAGANYAITATGAVTMNHLMRDPIKMPTPGLGATLAIVGFSITDDLDILLPTGHLTLHATSGDLTIGDANATKLDVGGTAQNFFDVVKYTNSGEIDLLSDHGNVSLGAASTVSVAAQTAGGNAGTLSILVPNGALSLQGTLLGQGGTDGVNGSFNLDVHSLSALSQIASVLDAGGFTESRAIRVRTGDVLVDGTNTSHIFELSADAGSIDVTGTIDASGTTGGTINLVSHGSLTLESGSVLTVAAQDFNHAGKGGKISLEAGSETDGVIDPAAMLDINAGSTIDLSVAANNPNSAALGNFTGTLHLRAPQTSSGTDVQMDSIDGTIIGASSIIVEGYKLFDLTSSGGLITSAVRNSVNANAATFLGTAGSASPTYQAMVDRLLANNASLTSITVFEPGAEIINRTGDLTLGAPNVSTAGDWNLATFRYGPNSAAGVLTLRAAGNLVFFNSLSDGFVSSAYTAALMTKNDLLPVNVQSWSYRLAAGADLSAADFHQLQTLDSLSADSGSLLLGKDGGTNIASDPGPEAFTSTAINPSGLPSRFQVIRTGTGDIDIAAGRDVKLLNQFASIYTAGVKITNPTLLPGGSFDVPSPNASGGLTNLGPILEAPIYPVQYSYAGGDVTVFAQNDIIHQTRDNNGNLIADSERELPINWLYRAGFVDPATGQFGLVRNRIASTTWWIDFANFFDGVAALGGGDVSLIAGHDVTNVDASVATNARMPKGVPDASNLLELGGGDLVIKAGHDIDGGVYYVGRGVGTLVAGGSIHTNSTRDPNLLPGSSAVGAPETWLPTTLFLSSGSFDVTARGDVLLGPVANPFLLPEGYSNTFWYKTYFSTYAATDSVFVSSLGGDITLRQSSSPPADGLGTSIPILQTWLQDVLLYHPLDLASSSYYPWLRLNETDANQFGTLVSLMPPTLRSTAFAGNINVVGNLTLFPSATGTIDLLAAGSINALQPNGETTINGVTTTAWATSRINLSDTNPAFVPGITSPFAYRATLANSNSAADNSTTGIGFLEFIDRLFAETGSTQGENGVLQTKQALHAAGLLHLTDPDPLHLYALSGNISGVTLFSGKASQIVAGRDITDIAFYIQNVRSTDVSIISSGRDLIAYDPSSPLRAAAQAPGSALDVGNGPLAGDIQISGPGTLEVPAGRNLDLGVGPNNPDGTGVGITSIGDARNPYLPFGGANIIGGAGIGVSGNLADSKLDFATFIAQFLYPGSAGDQSTRYLPELGKLLGLTNATDAEIWTAFKQLSKEKQDTFALDIFYLVLRDAGRDHNDPSSPGFRNFDAGYAAIAALFPDKVAWNGNVSLTSREIRTDNGGDIALFVPGGGLLVGFDIAGNQAADQGILTEHGGNISIFTRNNVDVGTSRIFTLRGGNEIIWSTLGNIAAGASSKTVQSAPPTRVLIDPQTADVKTDLAGLATGGGIGVLATVVGVPPGDVDLIAPTGVIDAGDAGIRVSGNLNLAAVQIINAGNIQVGGTAAGVPTVAAPNIGGLTSASNTAAATSNAAQQLAQNAPPPQEEVPSIINVEVLGYGGGDEDEEERRRKRQQQKQNQGLRRGQSERVASNSHTAARDVELSVALQAPHKKQ